MPSQRRIFLTAAAALFLGGCAGLRPGYERPSLLLDSFRPIPSEGMAPRFAIGLRVVNPNPTPLPLRGVSYGVEFEGHRVITGVAGNLETVPAYGESLIEVEAGVDLINGLRLFNHLLQDPQRDRLQYNLRARMDTGGLSRFLVIEESGELSLTSLQR
ncbi:LEA type 2 family protein [Thioalkalivibrio sp.]|uniref:LEA type 2 family protein n=1 Tax=Thioalkalivibrio sp. TaxID=2093813 RepID=UPI0039754EC8